MCRLVRYRASENARPSCGDRVLDVPFLPISGRHLSADDMRAVTLASATYFTIGTPESTGRRPHTEHRL